MKLKVERLVMIMLLHNYLKLSNLAGTIESSGEGMVKHRIDETYTRK